MFEFMDNLMPRRRNTMGTVTSMLIGATVGIATWEVIRRNTNFNKLGDLNTKQMTDALTNALDAE
jgi:glucose-6-phosphate dehydrogenase assembly protein OpcA